MLFREKQICSALFLIFLSPMEMKNNMQNAVKVVIIPEFKWEV